MDGIPPEKLVPLPSDYHSKDVKYGEESIEVLEVKKLYLYFWFGFGNIYN